MSFPLWILVRAAPTSPPDAGNLHGSLSFFVSFSDQHARAGVARVQVAATFGLKPARATDCGKLAPKSQTKKGARPAFD